MHRANLDAALCCTGYGAQQVQQPQQPQPPAPQQAAYGASYYQPTPASSNGNYAPSYPGMLS